MEFSRQNQAEISSQTVAYDEGLRAFFLRVYNYMAGALAVTGLVAFFGANSTVVMDALYNINTEGRMGLSGLGILVALAPLGFIFFLGFRINSMSVSAAQSTFWAFAVVMGLSMTSIFIAFTGTSIARVFFITAIMFGGMSLYGYTTKRDLTAMGSFMIMGAWGLMIGFLVNAFFAQSTTMHYVLSAVGVIIFTGLAAYDTQRLKSIYYQVSGYGDALAKASIMGALNLYLDFINMFQFLLQFLGDRR